MRNQRYEYGIRARNGEALTLDDVHRYAPAVLAEHPHESRSSRYVYIPTVDVMRTLMGEGFELVEARQGRTRDETRRGYAKHALRFRRAGDLTRRVGDVSFEVMLRASHDGTTCWDFLAGLFRLICLNGMTVDEGTVASVHVKHLGNREQILGNVIEGAFKVVNSSDKVLDAVRAWNGIQLARDEQMAFAERARVVRFGDSDGHVDTPITAAQLLIPRRSADQGNDLWRTLNVVQENTTKGGLTAIGYDDHNRPHRTTTREVRGIDGDIKLNRALWLLAENMAKLKS